MTAGSSSSLGLGLIPLLLRLEGPREIVTQRETQAVTGNVTGRAVARLTLYQNGTPRGLAAQPGAFQVAVSLEPGVNRLRVVATDLRGTEAEDVITVRYVPPVPGDGIRITSPPDGHRVLPDAPPVVLVEGEVEDRNASTVWLFANTRRVALPVDAGRFRHVLPLFEPVVSIWAETPPNGSAAHRSQTVLVGLARSPGSAAIVVLDWAQAAVPGHVELSALWRGRPDRMDAPVQAVSLRPFGPVPDGGLPRVFYLPQVKPGVYTLELLARGAPAPEARATLYLAQGGELRARNLAPVAAGGAERVVLARVLLPQGILWEQDDWFTGQSESVDAVTKFRLPEGITWTEPKRERR
ncbi:MAG: hypothetical protein ACREMB_02305 [Candidatus Rokuibacteriota bacterium]